ncbi:MAG: polysaccharide deacetylase family protein [Baekduia sp.]
MSERSHASVALLYHRVAESGRDPFGLAVSPAHFDEQMAVVAGLGGVLGFEDFAGRAGRRTLAPGSLTVTFDDGYADNADHGLPALERHGVPASVFILTGATGSDRPLWWDELAALIDPAAEGEAHSRAVIERWRALRRLPPAEIVARIDAIRAEAGRDPADADDARVMTAAELAALDAHPLVTLGAHTVRHPSLGAQPYADQVEEIRASRAALAAVVGREVTSFAYPFGRRRVDVTRATMRAAREAGVGTAATVEDREIRGGCDPLAVPRWMVPDVDGATFERMLHERLSGATPVRRVRRELRRALLDVIER